MKKQGIVGQKVMKELQADNNGYYVPCVNSLRMILARNAFKFRKKEIVRGREFIYWQNMITAYIM